VVAPPPGFTPVIGRLLAELQYVRWSTLRAVDGLSMAQRDDDWLEAPAPFDLLGGRPANNHFKWFHVAENELNHRGQIRWLRRRLPAF
jgi:hypothetical protein